MKTVKNTKNNGDMGVYGICMTNGTLYWSNLVTGKLQTRITQSALVQTNKLYTGGAGMRDLTSSWPNLAGNQENPCSAGLAMNCSGICVLSGGSFDCVNRKL